MAVDLRIRPLGRPKISKDSALGFQRIARRYVVEGRKVTKAGLDGSWDGEALFRPVGEPDEEFENHYLVNQQVEPGKTVDKAYLTREYAELRNTWSAESITESGHLKRLTRKYAIIRAVGDDDPTPVSLGYSASAFGNHPKQHPDSSNDPWDYLPKVILDTEPGAVSYEDKANINQSLYNSSRPHGLLPVSLGGVSLGSMLTGAGLSLKWLRASAQVDTSSPGVDAWTVSWAAPVAPFWSSGMGKGSKKALPKSVKLDADGITQFSFGSSGGASHAHTYTFYNVGPISLPLGLASLIPSDGQPSVSMDFHFIGSDGNHRAASFRQSFPNTLWADFDTDAGIQFPAQGGGGDVAVSDSQAFGEKFNYRVDVPLYTSPPGGYALYQGQPIQQAGGHITWASSMGSGGFSVLASTNITPIASHGDERIWKISLTYVN
jgi:hypothetical protein